MPINESHPTDFCTRRLYQAQIENPYAVAHDFFDCFELPIAVQFLKSWLYSADKTIWNKSYPAELLFFYAKLEALIEAAHLINQIAKPDTNAILLFTAAEQEAPNLMQANFFVGWPKYYSPWDYFPRSLNKKEFINPYLAIQKCFQFMDMPTWRETLYLLLYDAFVDYTVYEYVTNQKLLDLYRCLHKLLDATHLLDVRVVRKLHIAE